eukprot:scaffold34604_cov31-Tisochrysis_lutea.AAC.3
MALPLPLPSRHSSQVDEESTPKIVIGLLASHFLAMSRHPSGGTPAGWPPLSETPSAVLALHPPTGCCTSLLPRLTLNCGF